jgi:hypothetical protein
MHKRQILISISILFLLAALVVGLGQAQGLDTGDASRPDPPVANFINQDWVTTTSLPYTARLGNDLGEPVSDGVYAFSFTLYEAQSGGQPLWSEVQEKVSVQAGSLDVSLGSHTLIPLALLDGRSLWLEVGVRGPSETAFTTLSPRQLLSEISQASPSAPSSCLHDHFGEVWTGSNFNQGLEIYNSGSGYGLTVRTDGMFTSGVLVSYAEGMGMTVEHSGSDGVYVHQAGTPASINPSDYTNGFEVAGAEHSGLYVGYAGLDGVTVHSANWYGVYVEQSDSDGVRVQSAGGNGVTGISSNANYFGGLFRNNIAGGAGLYAAGGDNTAPDLVLGAYGAGDDGRIYSSPALTGSDLLFFSNDETHIHLDEDNNSESTFTIYNGANTAVFSVDETPKVTVAGPLVTRVETLDYGSRSTYALQATGNWYEDFGTAQLSNGVVVVPIDPVFAQVVSLAEYHVFLTPLGDCPLYVAEKTPSTFTVKAMGGQSCSLSFDYRIVAVRLGSEGQRLEPLVTSPDYLDD